jgi:hypothetical protein
MVPDNLNEAMFILARVDEYVAANIVKFAGEGPDGIRKIVEMTRIQENWQGVVSDLAEDEDEKPPAKATDRTSLIGGTEKAAKKDPAAKAGDAIGK